MKRATRQVRELVLEALCREGARDVLFDHDGRGHQRVHFVIGSVERRYNFPSTPSDKRSVINTVAGVRRVCREARQGVLPR